MKTRQPKQNYKQIILNHMLVGKTISTYEAYYLYDITCFLQRVSELRAQGIEIQDKRFKRNSKQFKVYWIEQPNDDNCGVSE